jgi:hypothetical protein
VEQVAGTEARTDPLDRRAIGHLLAHEGQCEGFDSPTHIAAQQRAQVTAHSAQHTTGCGSVTVRAGTGYSTEIRRLQQGRHGLLARGVEHEPVVPLRVVEHLEVEAQPSSGGMVQMLHR